MQAGRMPVAFTLASPNRNTLYQGDEREPKKIH